MENSEIDLNDSDSTYRQSAQRWDSPSPHGYLLEIARHAMACPFEILLHPGAPKNGTELAYSALDTITYLDDQWSVYKGTSELSMINARAQESPVPVSSSTKQLLALALEIHRRTDGAFDATSHKLSQAWGFYRREGQMPSEQEIASALQNVGSRHISLDRTSNTVHFRAPVEMNPGGIGKGLAIDMASSNLETGDVANYAFHGGKSSIRVRGRQHLESTEETGWKISVRHPEQSERVLGTLELRNQSLGTSGPANQFFYFKGKRFGHIIDPRTGWPAEGMLSVTVLHSDAGWADALATGLYVMGIDRAIQYCHENPDTSMLAILPAERVGQVEIVTCNLADGQWQTA